MKILEWMMKMLWIPRFIINVASNCPTSAYNVKLQTFNTTVTNILHDAYKLRVIPN